MINSYGSKELDLLFICDLIDNEEDLLNPWFIVMGGK